MAAPASDFDGRASDLACIRWPVLADVDRKRTSCGLAADLVTPAGPALATTRCLKARLRTRLRCMGLTTAELESDPPTATRSVRHLLVLVALGDGAGATDVG
jgi:hypothetical protein